MIEGKPRRTHGVHPKKPTRLLIFNEILADSGAGHNQNSEAMHSPLGESQVAPGGHRSSSSLHSLASEHNPMLDFTCTGSCPLASEGGRWPACGWERRGQTLLIPNNGQALIPKFSHLPPPRGGVRLAGQFTP